MALRVIRALKEHDIEATVFCISTYRNGKLANFLHSYQCQHLYWQGSLENLDHIMWSHILKDVVSGLDPRLENLMKENIKNKPKLPPSLNIEIYINKITVVDATFFDIDEKNLFVTYPHTRDLERNMIVSLQILSAGKVIDNLIFEGLISGMQDLQSVRLVSITLLSEVEKVNKLISRHQRKIQASMMKSFYGAKSQA